MFIKYKNKEWTHGVMRNASFWNQYIGNNFGYPRGGKFFGIKAPLVCISYVLSANITYVFFEKESLNQYENEIVNTFVNKKAILYFRKRVLQKYKKLLDIISICKKKPDIRNLKLFFDLYGIQMGSLLITTIIGRKFHEMLIESLRSDGVKDIDKTISSITYPNQHTPLFDSRLDLYRVAIRVKSNPNKREYFLKSWLNKYANVPINFSGDPWTFDDASNQLSKIMESKVQKELENLLESHKQKIHRCKIIEKKLSKRSRQLALVIREATIANEERKQIFCNLGAEYRTIFAHIAEQLGSTNWRDIYYLTPNEILDVVSGRSVSLKKIKSMRKEVAIINDEKGNISFVSKADLHIFRPTSNSGKIEQKELNGLSACKGVVRGIAKIILDRNDFNKFNKGDVLVASMTSVDCVPIMEMASAFVTDEGGITSHASIVAREMNKPCIIGTKIATKVLKDGDLVEVDANNGVVKILKKANG